MADRMPYVSRQNTHTGRHLTPKTRPVGLFTVEGVCNVAAIAGSVCFVRFFVINCTTVETYTETVSWVVGRGVRPAQKKTALFITDIYVLKNLK